LGLDGIQVSEEQRHWGRQFYTIYSREGHFLVENGKTTEDGKAIEIRVKGYKNGLNI